jgi:uracil-DNA glycosylase
LTDLASRIEACRACALGATRRRAIPGVGPAGATTMLVGTAPTWRAEEAARPLSDGAEVVLREAGIDPDAVFTATLVRCRPPAGRAPADDEIAACRPFLEEEAAATAPARVLALGSFATRHLAPDAPPFSAWHGLERPLRLGGHDTTLVPVLDPEAIRQVPSIAVAFWGPPAPGAASPPLATPAPDDDQLGLF